MKSARQEGIDTSKTSPQILIFKTNLFLYHFFPRFCIKRIYLLHISAKFQQLLQAKLDKENQLVRKKQMDHILLY